MIGAAILAIALSETMPAEQQFVSGWACTLNDGGKLKLAFEPSATSASEGVTLAEDSNGVLPRFGPIAKSLRRTSGFNAFDEEGNSLSLTIRNGIPMPGIPTKREAYLQVKRGGVVTSGRCAPASVDAAAAKRIGQSK